MIRESASGDSAQNTGGQAASGTGLNGRRGRRPLRRRPGTPSLGRRLLLVFLIALGLRAAYGGVQMYRTADPAALTFPDEEQYWMMAQALRQGQPLTDELGFHATRMPLYPGFLSLFAGYEGGLVGARIVQWGIGALAAVFACLLGAKVRGPNVGFVAGLIVALDLSLVGVSSLLLTETPFVAVLAALWWVGWPLGFPVVGAPARPLTVAARGAVACSAVSGGRPPGVSTEPGMGRWLGAGALSAACIYLRPSATGLVLGWAVFLLARRRFDRRGWVGGAIIVATVLLCLLPWALRNKRITGHLCWLTNRAGIYCTTAWAPGPPGRATWAGSRICPSWPISMRWNGTNGSWRSLFARSARTRGGSSGWRA